MSQAPFKPADTVDFVVIGSGAAGGVMAKELATAGFTVVVLEQGPRLGEKDFHHDEFGVTFRDALTNDLRLQPNSPAINAGRALPSEWPDPIRAADKDGPDLGALPLGVDPWGVGVDGRISLFGGNSGQR